MAGPVGIAFMVAGVIGDAISEAKAGKEEQKERERNAAILTAEAARERKSAGEQAIELRKKGKRERARARVILSKAGFKSNVGTGQLVEKEITQRRHRQAGIIQETGVFKESQKLSQADLQRRLGRAASKRSKLRAGTSLLTGLGRTALLGRKFR